MASPPCRNPLAVRSPALQTVSFSQELIWGEKEKVRHPLARFAHSCWCWEGFSFPAVPSARGAHRGHGRRETSTWFRDINFTISLERLQSKVLCDMITQGELSCICLMKQILCLTILWGIK